MKNKDLIGQMEPHSIAEQAKAPPEQMALRGEEQYNKNGMIVQTTKTQTL